MTCSALLCLQLWADLEAAGDNHLAAVREHESSSEDEESPPAEGDEGGAAAGGSLPGGSGLKRSAVRMLDQLLQPSKYWAASSMDSKGCRAQCCCRRGGASCRRRSLLLHWEDSRQVCQCPSGSLLTKRMHVSTGMTVCQRHALLPCLPQQLPAVISATRQG